MRIFVNYAIATVIATTLMAGPVLANDKGHHTKQSEPGYWMQESVQSTATKVESGKDAKDQVSKAPVEELRSGGNRHGRAYQPESANGDIH